MTSISVPESFKILINDNLYQISKIPSQNLIVAKVGPLQGLCRWQGESSQMVLYENWIKKDGKMSEYEKIFVFILGTAIVDFPKAELWLDYFAKCDAEKITFGLFYQKIGEYLAKEMNIGNVRKALVEKAMEK